MTLHSVTCSPPRAFRMPNGGGFDFDGGASRAGYGDDLAEKAGQWQRGTLAAFNHCHGDHLHQAGTAGYLITPDALSLDSVSACATNGPRLSSD